MTRGMPVACGKAVRFDHQTIGLARPSAWRPLIGINRLHAPIGPTGPRRPRVYQALDPFVPGFAPTTGAENAPGQRGTAMLLDTMHSIDAKEAPSLAPDDRPI